MSLKHELKLIGKGMLEQLSPKLFLATSLEQTAPKKSKGWIYQLRGYTKRKIHIETQRIIFALNKKYYRAECYRRYGRNCLRCLKEFHRVRFADQIDHAVSLYNFGKTEDDNHQPLCGECNLWKW